MNNKQLAEMIKRLRKDRKENELATTDMNTTSSMKGAGHDIVEYQVRSGGTSPHLTKTLSSRNAAIDSGNQPKAGNDIQGRYHPHIRTEDKDEVISTTATKSKKNNNVINTEPEQKSAMIGTQ